MSAVCGGLLLEQLTLFLFVDDKFGMLVLVCAFKVLLAEELMAAFVGDDSCVPVSKLFVSVHCVVLPILFVFAHDVSVAWMFVRASKLFAFASLSVLSGDDNASVLARTPKLLESANCSASQSDNGSSFVCVCLCTVRLVEFANLLVHTSQEKGLSPVCTRTCLLSDEESANILSHVGHEYGFSPECVRL